MVSIILNEVGRLLIDTSPACRDIALVLLSLQILLPPVFIVLPIVVVAQWRYHLLMRADKCRRTGLLRLVKLVLVLRGA